VGKDAPKAASALQHGHGRALPALGGNCVLAWADSFRDSTAPADHRHWEETLALTTSRCRHHHSHSAAPRVVPKPWRSKLRK